MLLKNVKVLRPKTTKIQKKNGIGYVYRVIGKSYKKKKYTVENRKLIGKMIDEEWMIPNEYFEQYYPDVCGEQVKRNDKRNKKPMDSFTICNVQMDESKKSEKKFQIGKVL